jgi:hypothetical protein
VTHANDQHVIPTDSGEHLASPACPCRPRVDDGVPHRSGARVWIHTRWLDIEATEERD